MPRLPGDGPPDVAEPAPDDGVSAAGHSSPPGDVQGGTSDCTGSLGRLTAAADRSIRALGRRRADTISAVTRALAGRASAPRWPTCSTSSAPTRPTCCEGWDTAHLAAHLVVRDRRPDAMPGFGVERLPGWPAAGPVVAPPSRTGCARRTPYAEVVGAGAVRAAVVVADGAAAASTALVNRRSTPSTTRTSRRAQPGLGAPGAAPRGPGLAVAAAVLVRPRPAAARAGGVRAAPQRRHRVREDRGAAEP